MKIDVVVLKVVFFCYFAIRREWAMSEIPTFPDEQFTAPINPFEHNGSKSRKSHRQQLSGSEVTRVLIDSANAQVLL
jgi:hypothetical protein